MRSKLTPRPLKPLQKSASVWPLHSGRYGTWVEGWQVEWGGMVGERGGAQRRHGAQAHLLPGFSGRSRAPMQRSFSLTCGCMSTPLMVHHKLAPSGMGSQRAGPLAAAAANSWAGLAAAMESPDVMPTPSGSSIGLERSRSGPEERGSLEQRR